jgi:hypothetical protein
MLNRRADLHIRLHTAPGRYFRERLQRVVGRPAERAWLACRGIELTQWGRDHASRKVKVYLSHYDDAARQVLLDRYGTAIIVSTESRSWTFTE